jgi:hypothetical protein
MRINSLKLLYISFPSRERVNLPFTIYSGRQYIVGMHDRKQKEILKSERNMLNKEVRLNI